MSLDDVALRLTTPTETSTPIRPIAKGTTPSGKRRRRSELTVTDAGLELSEDHLELRALTVSKGWPMGARVIDLSPLRQRVHLRELTIPATEIVPKDIAFLSALPKLTSLWIRPPPGVTDLRFLENTSLRVVRLVWPNQIRSLESLSLPDLTCLDVNSSVLADAVLTERLPNLESLSLSGTSLTIRSTTVLKALRQLTIRADTLRNLDFLTAFPNLEHLGLTIERPIKNIEPLLAATRLRSVTGSTRALSKADREHLERHKPGAIRLWSR